MGAASVGGLDQQAVYALIARVAGQANILTIPRLFIDWTGDHISALLLSQVVYWSSRTADPEGWFYKSAKDWESELGISDYQLARATKKLVDAGVATKLRKVQGAPTLHYRLDQERFLGWISEKLGNGFPQQLQPDFRETGKWISQEPGNGSASSLGMDLAEAGRTLTETTAETTNREIEDSKVRKTKLGFADKYDEARLALLPYVEDFARELGDQAPLAASVSRVVGIYKRSGLSFDAFAQALYQARAITKEYQATIRAGPAVGDPWGKKPKMAYFCAVLEDLVTSHLERDRSAD